MKKFFYLLIGLVMLPALIYAQGTMSPKDLYDYVTANYYTKTVSDGKYATTVDVALKADKTYVDDNFATTAAVALKADKTYVDGTDENIINTLLPAKADQTDMDSAEAAINALNIDNDSQDVQIEANRVAITTKATTTDMDSAEAAIQLILADNDSQDVAIEANKVGVASVEVGLQTHQNNPTGAHAATAISTTSWDNAQTCLDSLEAAIQNINVGSGFATTAQVSQEVLVHNENASAHATKFADYYDKTATDATIEAAIAAIPTPSVNQTVTVPAGEALTAGQVVSLINKSGTMKAYNNPLTVSTSPNGAESVFNAAATTYCSAVALDSTRFLVAYVDSDTYPKAVVGTVSGSSITWGTESDAFYTGGAATYMSVCKVNTNKVLAIFNSNGFTIVEGLGINATTNAVTVYSGVIVDNNAGTYISCATLDTDKALVCYRDNETSTKGQAKILTVSGYVCTPYPDAATAGTEFNTAATAYISVSARSSTSAIVAYQDGGNSNYGTAQILSISGTTITPGDEKVYYSGTSNRNTVSALSTTSALVTYNKNATTGWAQVLTIDGTTIDDNTEYQVGESPCYGITNQKINSTHALIAYEVNDANGSTKIATIDGTTISFGAAYVFNSGNSLDDFTIAMLSSSRAIIAFSDYTNSSYGTSVVSNFYSSSYASVAGISQGAYSAGSDSVILISGLDENQSGLLTGSEYYLQSDFSIGTTPISLAKYYNSSTATGEIKVGTAKSSTEIILGIDYK